MSRTDTIYHSRDIPVRFEGAFLRVCEKLAMRPIDLLGVMMSESGVRAAARNPNGGAIGLIQFMPPILAGLGWRRPAEEFGLLTADQQLPFVEAYFRAWAKDAGGWDSAGRIYQATFLPATLRTMRGEDAILCERGGRLGWAFEANSVFDANGDGRITVGELTASVFRACKGPRWLELIARLGLEAPPVELRDADGDGVPELATLPELQVALARVGFDPGAPDGLMGPRTRAAIVAFQKERGLAADGIAGPLTRRELALAVATAA